VNHGERAGGRLPGPRVLALLGASLLALVIVCWPRLSYFGMVMGFSAGSVEAQLRAVEGLVAHGEEATPLLIRGLGSPEARLRWACARGLGRLGAVAAAPALLASLGGDDRRLAAHAAHALGSFGEAGLAAGPALLRASCSEDVNLRAASVMALGRLVEVAVGDRAAAIEAGLAARLEDASATVARLAQEALKGRGRGDRVAEPGRRVGDHRSAPPGEPAASRRR
jgi:hypothetical protein